MEQDEIKQYMKVASDWENKFSICRIMLRSEIKANKILKKENEKLSKILEMYGKNTINKIIIASSVSVMINILFLGFFLLFY